VAEDQAVNFNIQEKINTVICGDALESLKTLPDESVDCVITSPPYYQLRDYGFSGQIGLENTYQEYLNKMIEIMSELKRVLKPTGTMWINLGDTYSTKSGSMGSKGMMQPKFSDNANKTLDFKQTKTNLIGKSLMLIPHRFAIRCIDELNLILRNDIIWGKQNALPESAKDRFSKKHEFIFFFVKQKKYYFDLESIKDTCKTKENRPNGIVRNRIYKYDSKANNQEVNGKINTNNISDKEVTDNYMEEPVKKNPGDVSDFWDINTKPNKEKHYATFNTDLINKPIVAGCPEDGIILDPFAGTGTTLIAGLKLNRKVIGIDGKQEYCDIANRRIQEFITNEKM
jgi:site-specific DNA-methyltransferase (adenine-specific)